MFIQGILLEMHHSISLDTGDWDEVTRVPGGLLYFRKEFNDTGALTCTSQFVPCDDID